MAGNTRRHKNAQRMRLRQTGGRAACARKHGARDEFPSLWESMEEDVSDQFEDLWRRI